MHDNGNHTRSHGRRQRVVDVIDENIWIRTTVTLSAATPGKHRWQTICPLDHVSARPSIIAKMAAATVITPSIEKQTRLYRLLYLFSFRSHNRYNLLVPEIAFLSSLVSQSRPVTALAACLCYLLQLQRLPPLAVANCCNLVKLLSVCSSPRWAHLTSYSFGLVGSSSISYNLLETEYKRCFTLRRGIIWLRCNHMLKTCIENWNMI